MALKEGKLDLSQQPDLLHRVEPLPDVRKRARRQSFAQYLTEPKALPRWVAIALVASWVAVVAGAIAIEPAPANAGETESVLAGVVGFGMLASLTAAGVGLVRRQRSGLLASMVGAGLFLVATVMCPVSGHHGTIGTWWYAQMAGFLALGAASLVALRASRPTP